MIPVSNPKASFETHFDCIMSRIHGVLSSGMYILGREVTLFEGRFAEYCETKYCISVANGTEAIAIALLSVGVKAGDEVITVSHTSVATVAAIEIIGAIPVFVDIESDSFNMDPNKIEEMISTKTTAVVPVHLYGIPCRIDAVCEVAKKYNLKVVEDCCQAHGATYNNKRVGSFGDAGAFSFYPTKNLGALGDAGAIVTNSLDVKECALLLREYGWKTKQYSIIPGINSRMDEIQAAVLNAKLTYLSDDITRRRIIASMYLTSIIDNSIILPKTDKFMGSVWHLFVIRSPDRDQFANYLNSKGIQTNIHYPYPIHLQPAYAGRIKYKSLVNTENVSKEILSIPLFPKLSDDEVLYIISILNSLVLTWDEIKTKKIIKLYLGEVPKSDEYKGWLGVDIQRRDKINVLHNITAPFPLDDNSVDMIQSEDVFEHIVYEKIVFILDEIYRILKPGGSLRLSVPDFGCDVYRDRVVKSTSGEFLFDPGGGMDNENVMGHKWFPTYDSVYYLLQKSLFGKNNCLIDFLHYYKGDSFVVKNIDYSKGHVSRTPDFDTRVQNPRRPLSLVVDIIK